MFIVDAQLHIWRAEAPDRLWAPGARERIRVSGHRQEPFGYEECVSLMDGAGVSRAVIVPPAWEGERIDYALDACAAYPERFAIMARIPQDRRSEGRAIMRELSTIPAIKGIRLTFHRPIDRDWMIDGTCDWIWPYAEQLGLKVMVEAPTWKPQLGTIAARHPGLRLIIDHMGVLAGSVDDAIGHWVSETADLHVHPNISIKLSAVPAYSTDPYPYANIARYVRSLVEQLGPARCHWGTDMTRLMGRGLTYLDAVEHFTEHMGFSANELDWIMGRGLCDVLEWPITGGRHMTVPPARRERSTQRSPEPGGSGPARAPHRPTG
jgi:predicted TIM-barrel fold metal-dependent hydrolase